jgi:hypothetical protein
MMPRKLPVNTGKEQTENPFNRLHAGEKIHSVSE